MLLQWLVSSSPRDHLLVLLLMLLVCFLFASLQDRIVAWNNMDIKLSTHSIHSLNLLQYTMSNANDYLLQKHMNSTSSLLLHWQCIWPHRSGHNHNNDQNLLLYNIIVIIIMLSNHKNCSSSVSTSNLFRDEEAAELASVWLQSWDNECPRSLFILIY